MFHAGVMTPGQIVLDVAMGVVVLSLIAIVLVFLIGTAAGMVAMTRAGRGDRGAARQRRLEQLWNGCELDDLADIDETLDRVAAQEYGGRPTTSRW